MGMFRFKKEIPQDNLVVAKLWGENPFIEVNKDSKQTIVVDKFSSEDLVEVIKRADELGYKPSYMHQVGWRGGEAGIVLERRNTDEYFPLEARIISTTEKGEFGRKVVFYRIEFPDLTYDERLQYNSSS